MSQSYSLNESLMVAVDPTATSVNAEKGSLLLLAPAVGAALVYQKQDSGDSTNWTLIGSQNLSQVLTVGNDAGAVAITNLSTLKDATNVNAVDIPNRLLFDQAGLVADDFNGRILYDVSGVESLLWQSRILYDTSTIVSLDWSNRAMFDSTNLESIDYQNRQLHDASSLQSIDYTARQLTGTNGSTVMIDWSGANVVINGGASGSFTSVDLKIVTVVNGIITSIV